MADFQPPPTFAEVVLYEQNAPSEEALLRSARFNPIWLKWFVDVAQLLTQASGGSGGPVSGPAGATNNHVVFFNGPSGTIIKDSGLNLSGNNTGDQTSVSGNAGTATVLQTARNINGVSFNGSADITVTAAAATLTGNTLAAGVVNSSLTSVGTLTSLTTSGALVALSIRPSAAGGYLANDTSPGISTSITSGGLVGKTITVKDGLITGFA